MMLLNNLTSRHALTLQLALLAVFWSSSALSQENQLASPSDSNAKLEKSSVTEGRSAVNFYPNAENAETSQSRLSDKNIPYPASVVERLQPLLEFGDPFLGNGPIQPGIKTPTGQMLQPWFLLYGSLRSAFQSSDDGNHNKLEWANRLDLHGNVNFSGTERLVFSMRPLDRQTGGYSGYNFKPQNGEGWIEDFNATPTQLYFEGDFGEIFPELDPTDSHTYDLGFSIGRQRLQLQDGILINSNIDMLGITRNSLVFSGIPNLRVTGIYSWNHINQGNNNLAADNNNQTMNLFGLSSQADTAFNSTVNLDLLYAANTADSAWYVGASSTQRFGWLNSTFRVNASIPQSNQHSQKASGGELLLAQLSATLPHTDNLLYWNTFWNIDQFSSAGRGQDQGTPVASLGILYGPVGMGRYAVPLGASINNTVGTVLGYQMFLNGIDSQLIFEVGARHSTKSTQNDGMLGLGVRYQHTIGKRHVLRLDSTVSGKEGNSVGYGLRAEWMIKF